VKMIVRSQLEQNPTREFSFARTPDRLGGTSAVFASAQARCEVTPGHGPIARHRINLLSVSSSVLGWWFFRSASSFAMNPMLGWPSLQGRPALFVDKSGAWSDVTLTHQLRGDIVSVCP